MLAELRKLHKELKDLKRDVSKEPGPQIAKNGLRKRAEAISTNWFSTISPSLAQHHSVSTDVVERYSGLFATLLKLSRPNNLRSRYLDVLNNGLRKFHNE